MVLLGTRRAKTAKSNSILGNVGGPENGPKTGHASISYGYLHVATVATVDEDDGRGTDASPSPAARLTSQLARRNAF